MEDIIKLLSQTINVTPNYKPDLCLAVKQSRTACSACSEVCPHEAITLTSQVEIDEVDCTGCGLCVRSCPSYALETNETLKSVTHLRCSQVDGEAAQIHCFGRLGATDLLKLSDDSSHLHLGRSNCSECPIGSDAVIGAVEDEISVAKKLANVCGQEITIEFCSVESMPQDVDDSNLSRRDLFRQSIKGLQQATAIALSPLDPGDETNGLPNELRQRYFVLDNANLAPTTQVPWVLPRISDGCIMCPVCTQVCPTNAFHRTFNPKPEEGAVLELDPGSCMGCDACVQACPINVITLDDKVTWGELSNKTIEAFHKPPDPDTADTIPR